MRPCRSQSGYVSEEKGGWRYLFCPPLLRLDWLRHAFSTRTGPGGDSNLALHIGEEPGAVAGRRGSFLSGLGLELDRFVAGEQVHGSAVRAVDESAGGAGARDISTALPATDGLATMTAGLALAIFTADCLPLLLADPGSRAVAAVHAGWRGAAAGIPARAVDVMSEEFGARPEEMLAALGPCIGPCCYEVGPELADRLPGRARPDVLLPANGGKFRLDLPSLVRFWLLERGLRPERIFSTGLCTSCRSDLFFSHRRDRGRTGRMMSVIARIK